MAQDPRFQEDNETQVGMFEGDRPFISLVKNDDVWGLGDIGQVTRHRVEQGAANDLFSYTFQSGNVSDRTDYQIGSVKSTGFLDHASLYEPLLDNGWVVRSHIAARGGLSAMTIFDYPEVQFPDPIDWDQRLFDVNLSDSYLTPSIIVKANTRSGSRYHATAGFLRLICTNGLVAKALDLGAERYSIWNNDYDTVANSMYELAEGARTMQPFNDRAGVLYPTRSARWLARELLEFEAPKPQIITESLSDLTRHLQEGERADLARNFALMATQHESPDLSVLDVLNAVTNASTAKALSSIDQALDAANSLLGLGAYITR